MKTRQVFYMLVLAVCSVSAFAQGIPEAQKNLMQFVGKWTCKNPTLNIAGKNYDGEYSFDCEAVNMNTGIIAHEKFSNETLNLIGENLIGYDPNLQQVHLYSIDNLGTAHDHYGYWIDDRHLFVQYQGVVEGKMYVEQINMIFKDPNTFALNLTGMLNGEIFEKAEGTFMKQQKVGRETVLK